jgi:excinuclease ABC subunit B
MRFELVAPYKMSPGQEEAVGKLVKNFETKDKQTILALRAAAKTFVMANVIQKLQKPTLILAHNKTLAAQLYAELRSCFRITGWSILSRLFVLPAGVVSANHGHVHRKRL